MLMLRPNDLGLNVAQAGYPPFFTEDGNPMKLYEKVIFLTDGIHPELTFMSRSLLAKSAIRHTLTYLRKNS